MSLSQTKTQARNTTTINGNKPQGKQHKNIHKICTAYPLEALGNLEQTILPKYVHKVDTQGTLHLPPPGRRM